jgi:predicted molibdopterin-dependent oxidoreductase YjgC
MYIIGENPMVSDADLNHAEKSLKNLEFLVVQDIFMTETAKWPMWFCLRPVLPKKRAPSPTPSARSSGCARRSMRPGQCKDDWWITSQMASRMGYAMAYENSQAIFEEIAKVTPSYGGITYARIETEGLHWPCPTTDHPGTPILHTQQFTRGKGISMPSNGFRPPSRWMTTTRSI